MNKIKTGLVVALALVLGTGGAAYATPTVQDQVTTMATGAFGDLVPIVIAIGTAAVGVAVAWFAMRLVLRAVKGGGRV